MQIKKVLLTLVMAIIASSGWSGTYTWNGGSEGNWSVTSNWLCDGQPASALPGENDKVDLADTTATLVLTENVAVGYFWAFREGSSVTVKSGTPGTRYALSIKKSYEGALGGWGGGFPGYMSDDVKLTLDGVELYPNYEGNAASQWGLNTSPVNFRNPGTIEITNGGLYVGTLGTWSTLSLVLHSSALWIRDYGSVAGLDVVLDDSTWSGYQKEITVAGDLSVTFAGTAPQLKTVGNVSVNPNVSGTTTFKYVLPASPYAASPVVNEGAVNFAPAGSFAIEIDPDSPGLKSGAKQTYRLMAYEKDAGKGLNHTGASYPTMRTSEEKFTTSFMPGASTSGLPQYLDLTVDGTYDPSSVSLDVTFDLPYPSDAGEVFGGTIRELGTGATKASVVVKYGTTEALENEVTLGEVTEAGPFAFTLTGLDSSATYHYRLAVTTDAGGEMFSEAGTFSLLCGSVLDNTVTPSLNNGQGRISGSLAVVGSGETTVYLWVGRTADTLERIDSVGITSADFGFDYTFADEGDWVVRFTCENSSGGKSWSDTESVAAFPVAVKDANTYTLQSGVGAWTDTAMWSCGASGSGLGYPTSGSSVVFPADVESEVTLPKDVTLAQLTVLSANSRVTLKGDGVTLLVPSPNDSNRKILSAKGVNSELTLDGVKLTDNANVWSICWQCEPGDGSVIRLQNGARLEAKQINPQSDDVTFEAVGGSTVYLRESWNGNTHSFKAVLENSTLEIYDKVLMVSEFVFKGTNPVARVCNFAEIPVTLKYELPETPYLTAPLQQSEGRVGGGYLALDGGQVSLQIAADSPARIAKRKGDYPLISWERDAEKGINTNNFVSVTGMKPDDRLDWSWKEGSDPLEVNPRRLTYHLASRRGITVFFR